MCEHVPPSFVGQCSEIHYKIKLHIHFYQCMIMILGAEKVIKRLTMAVTD